MPVPPLAVAIVWIAVILGVTAGFFFVVRKWAGKTAGDRQSANDLLTNFRELHASGDLTDSEYRNIKATLAPALSLEAEGLASAEAVAELAAELKREAGGAGPVSGPSVGAGLAGEAWPAERTLSRSTTASDEGCADVRRDAVGEPPEPVGDEARDDCAGPPASGGDGKARDR